MGKQFENRKRGNRNDFSAATDCSGVQCILNVNSGMRSDMPGKYAGEDMYVRVGIYAMSPSSLVAEKTQMGHTLSPIAFYLGLRRLHLALAQCYSITKKNFKFFSFHFYFEFN